MTEFLRDAVVLAGVAVAALLVWGRLRLPAVVGLLLTGVLIGPSVLGLLGDVHDVEVFAEIGVVLLLFAIGLELSIERLRELRRIFLIAGGGQTMLTIAATAAIGLLLAFPWQRALFFGFLVALSSTAVVLKLFQERNEDESPPGRAALGILLFQDVMVVPMIVLLPVLAGEHGGSLAGLATRLGLSLVGVVVLGFAARWAFPFLIRLMARSGMREALLLGALGVCAGTALLTEMLGFSLALGAFLAGVLISESEHSVQVHAEIGPLRDVFSSVFFLSVGMLLDLRALADDAMAVALLALGLILLKVLCTGVAVKALGYTARPALVTALALAQIGEFSFVLLELGRDYQLIGDLLYQRFLGAAVLSLAAAPLFIQLGPAWTDRLLHALDSDRSAVPPAPDAPRSEHVIVAGFGVNGQVLSRVFPKASIPFTIIEFDPQLAHRARAEGLTVVSGDCTRPEILDHAGVHQASVLILAISDDLAARRAVQAARRMSPGIEIIVRTRSLDDIPRMKKAGASVVIATEFETTLEILARVLRRFHVPPHLVRLQTRMLRGESYQMLRSPSLDEGVADAVVAALQAGTTELVQISRARAGETLAEIDLRRQCGATVVAVVRDGVPHLSPPGDFRLEHHDTLVVVGSHQQIDRAMTMLAKGRLEKTD